LANYPAVRPDEKNKQKKAKKKKKKAAKKSAAVATKADKQAERIRAFDGIKTFNAIRKKSSYAIRFSFFLMQTPSSLFFASSSK